MFPGLPAREDHETFGSRPRRRDRSGQKLNDTHETGCRIEVRVTDKGPREFRLGEIMARIRIHSPITLPL